MLDPHKLKDIQQMCSKIKTTQYEGFQILKSPRKKNATYEIELNKCENSGY